MILQLQNEQEQILLFNMLYDTNKKKRKQGGNLKLE
jgi:hypothetical protein